MVSTRARLKCNDLRLLGAFYALLLVSAPLRSALAEPSADTRSLESAAPEARDEEARARFEAGRLAFEAGRFADALEDFGRAYELSKRPGLLFNMGASCARLQQREQALEYFERYRTELPEARNRAEVDAKIQELRTELSRARAASRQSAAQTHPAVAPAPLSLAEEPGALRRWPWALVAGGAAVSAAGGVLLWLSLQAKDRVEHPAAGSTWADVRADDAHVKPWSIAGSALLGVGALTLASGLVLRFWRDSGSERAVVGLSTHGIQLRGKF
jgi:tetratricopeptide (TPR) repeat protein